MHYGGHLPARRRMGSRESRVLDWCPCAGGAASLTELVIVGLGPWGCARSSGWCAARTGEPYTAKAVGASDVTGACQPVICTSDALDTLTGHPGARRLVDAKGELLPLVFAKMQVGYYTQAALLTEGAAEAGAVRRRLRCAWASSSFEPAIKDLATRYDPRAQVAPPSAPKAGVVGSSSSPPRGGHGEREHQPAALTATSG